MSRAREAREFWTSRLGVIFAVMGSAVGLGNFLRFPGQAAQHDIAAFMIAYFISLVLLGLPLALAEWAMGRYGGVRGYSSAPGVFRLITGRVGGAYLGLLGVLIPLVIFQYYVVIEAWCLGYALRYFSGSLIPAAESESVFVAFTGLAGEGELFHGKSPLFWLVVFCFVLNMGLIYFGIRRGIEVACRIGVPLLMVLAIVLVVRVLTLGTPDPAHPERNVMQALGRMWNPGGTEAFWNSMFNPAMWLAAAGQIFFSLSVGFGVVITYASYVRRNEDIVLSGTTSVAGNEFCEVALGGMLTLPAAFLFLGAAVPLGSAMALGFVALPGLFTMMPAGHIFGGLFFLLLFLAAVTSSISMVQPAVAFFQEGFGVSRKMAIVLVSSICVCGTGLVMYFSKDLKVLDTLDFWVGTFCIFLLALIQTIVFGWVLGPKRGWSELKRGAAVTVPRVILFVLRYITPVILTGVFLLWTYQQFFAIDVGKNNRVQALMTDHVAQIAFGWIIVVVILLGVSIQISVERWKGKEK
jgi:NSS family neurotransmitter:Na+ symporter